MTEVKGNARRTLPLGLVLLAASGATADTPGVQCHDARCQVPSSAQYRTLINVGVKPAGASRFDATIVGGTPPVKDEKRTSAIPELDAFDDVVAVARGSRWHCSGILLDRDVVLTAAHCLPADTVRFGSDADAPRLTATVISALRFNDRRVDAALLRIDRSPKIPPRTRRSPTERQPPTGIVRVVGFGATNARGTLGAGHKLQADLVPRGWGCGESASAMGACLRGFEFSLQALSGRDTCNGDSGGPVFEFEGARWSLIGITSRAIQGAALPCGSGGVYVRTDAIDGWIVKTMEGWAKESR